MRRILAVAAGFAAAIAGLRLLGRQRAPAALGPPTDEPDPRADALRAKLAEARGAAAEEQTAAAEEREVPVDRAEPLPLDPDERRRRVHEAGRTVADEMRRAGG